MKNASSSEKPIVSDGRLSRVKNFITSSPSRLRRAMSLGATSSSTQVFGSTLPELVGQEDRAAKVPFIVTKILHHLESNGLDEEGLYRINGNSKVIEKLKMLFDKDGDASFNEIDIAAVAGLLKLFLRELAAPVVPEELAEELVLIQQAYPSRLTAEGLLKIRQTLEKFPPINLAVLKTLVKHLALVAEHSSENKMTAVSLSIVFGPNLFRCPPGVQGLKMQGYSNSIVCKLIQNHTKLFDSEDVEESIAKRKRSAPSKPRPYSEHISLKKRKEEPATTDGRRSLSPVDNLSVESRERSYSERSIDEAIESSTPSPHPEDVFQDPLSPPTAHEPLAINTTDEAGDGGESTFERRFAKRRIKFRPRSVEDISPDGIAKSASNTTASSKHPRHTQLSLEASREELLRTPSPHSWQSSPGTSPPTSPSHTLTPRTSSVVSSVIGESVRRFLFEPPSPPTTQRGSSTVKHTADVYGLLLPDKALHKLRHQKGPKKSPLKGDSNLQADASGNALEVPAVKRRKGGEGGGRRQRNRKSALFGQDTEAGSPTSPIEEMDVQLLSVDTDHVTQSRVGKVSDLAKQFEKSGMIMGTAPIPRLQASSADQEPKDQPLSGSTVTGSEDLTTITALPGPRSTVSDEDVFASPDHCTSPSKQNRRQLSTTTSDDVFLSPRPTLGSDEPDTAPSGHTATASDDSTGPRHTESGFDDFDAVKSSGPLQHITLSRPKGPTRSKPRSRAISSPAITKPASPASEEVDFHTPPSTSPSADDLRKAPSKSDSLEGVQKERSSSREQRRKTTKVSADSPRRAKKHRHSEPADAGLSSQLGAPSRLARQPLLDLTSLAPESQANISGVTEGWSGTSESLVTSDGCKDGSVSSARQLGHRIHELKSIVREYEADFSAKQGRKPSNSEKTPIAPQLEELSKLRKQFKEMKAKQSEPRLSQTAPTESSTAADSLTQLAKTASGSSLATPVEVPHHDAKRKLSSTRESATGLVISAQAPSTKLGEMLDRLMAVLDDKRQKASRPPKLHDMTQEQLLAEKQCLQKALLQFEKHNGRPQTKEDKETMRPLYDRYRMVKKLLGAKPQERPSIVSTSSQDQEVLGATVDSLPSVTLLQSGLARSLPPTQATSASGRLSKSATELVQDSKASQGFILVAAADDDHVTSHVTSHVSNPAEYNMLDTSELGDTSCEELVRHKEAALEVKKQLRKVLKEFETAFANLHGRAVARDDRRPMQREYKDYKNAKARLQMIDALIAKKTDPQR